MLAPEDRPPQIARVMKIVSAEEAAAAQNKVEKFADDYAESSDADGDDSEPAAPVARKPQNDGWNVVAAKKSESGSLESTVDSADAQNPCPCRLEVDPATRDSRGRAVTSH